MIYVPNYNNSQCAYIRDANTLRVYNSVPTQNSTVAYTDYYINSHYIHTTGTTTFNNYTSVPTCLVSTDITESILYRNDLADIMIVLFIILTLFYFIIKKCVRALFWGGRFA